MRADFQALDGYCCDLAVVGGGVTGAFTAWDASLRGLSVALLEKQDFCGATSFANSRLIHGGLRYLRQGQYSVVRESLSERRYWLWSAPHLVRPLPFMIPVPHWRRRLAYGVGLALYQLFGGASALPRHRYLSPRELATEDPLIRARGEAGAMVYYDAQMAYPERLVIAALQGAARRGAKLANYCAVRTIDAGDTRGFALSFQDLETGRHGKLHARKVVNASGPWADQLELPGRNSSIRLTRSAGIHLVTRQIVGHHALALETGDDHCFILPWEGHSLIGTTDEIYAGDPDEYRVVGDQIDRLLQKVNAALPELSLRRSDVLYAYGGMRVLIGKPERGGTYRASRRSEILEHDVPGLYSAVGGKWTTSRALAADVVDRICDRPGRTHRIPLPGRPDPDRLDAHSSPLLTHLIRLYGNRAEEILGDRSDNRQLLPAARPVIARQARHAVEHEWARRLADVVFRRTGIGYFGPVPPATLRALAAAMAGPLGWDQARQDSEISSVAAHYREPIH